LSAPERKKIGLLVATRAGATCKFGFACKHGSRCRGMHTLGESALFKTRECKVSDLERSAGCAYCRVGVCRYGSRCRGQTAVRAARRQPAASGALEVTPMSLPFPRAKLRKRGRRRPRGRPPEDSRQGRRLERQAQRKKEIEQGTPSNERVLDSSPSRRSTRRDSDSSSDEEPTDGENQPGRHQCCSEDPVCASEASIRYCGLWFCERHSPSAQTPHPVSSNVSQVAHVQRTIRLGWDRITVRLTESALWGVRTVTGA
jgi:hypothetical protein